MIKDFFNRPALPSHDDKEPSSLSIGDVFAIVVYTAVIIGGAYVAVEIIDYLRPETSATEEPVIDGTARPLPHFVQQALG